MSQELNLPLTPDLSTDANIVMQYGAAVSEGVPAADLADDNAKKRASF